VSSTLDRSFVTEILLYLVSYFDSRRGQATPIFLNFKDDGLTVVVPISSWVDYHDMPPEQEKEYIRKAVESLTSTCGSPPKGWYYGRLSPRSRALVWEVYHEMGIPLLWESDSYEDDLPYWVDVPGEKESQKPEGMLMIPYSYGRLKVMFSVLHVLPYR
jgi:hypothetical protein